VQPATDTSNKQHRESPIHEPDVSPAPDLLVPAVSQPHLTRVVESSTTNETVPLSSHTFQRSTVNEPRKNLNLPMQPDLDLFQHPQGSQITNAVLPQESINLDPVLLEIDHFIQAQEDITSIRVQAQQKRNALRRARRYIAKCDEAYMGAIRRARAAAAVPDPDTIATLFDACQNARDLCGPLEDAYDQLDLSLVPREFDLTRRNEVIKSAYDAARHSIENSRLSQVSSQSSQSSHESQQHKDALNDTPASVDDMVMVLSSEPDLTQDTEAEVLPETTGLHRFPITPRPSNVGSAGIGSLEATAVVHEHVLFDQYAPDLQSGQDWYSSYSSTAPTSYVSDHNLVDSKDADANSPEEGEGLLLGDDDGRRAFVGQDLSSPKGTHHRVNLWLLHKLRISRWEIQRLKEEVNSVAKSIGNWTDTALDNWDSDEAAQPAVLPPATSASTDVRHESMAPRFTSWPQSSTKYTQTSTDVRHESMAPRFTSRPQSSTKYTQTWKA
jgi:hypothetical protein